MNLTGAHFVGLERRVGSGSFTGFNAVTREPLSTTFTHATAEIVDEAVCLANEAFETFPSVLQRQELLLKIADLLENSGDGLREVANLETALPMQRLIGERARTCFQLRAYSEAIPALTAELEDPGDAGRQPLPKPHLVRSWVGIGPVAVFGASNFPFAYSVAGGDTASAIAAGCPVVVKAHPSHPGTSEMTAALISEAVASCGLHAGWFSMVFGGAEAGEMLVRHPLINGVGFTGSQRGGRALYDLGASRPDPIPVFAEMGSVNPVFVLAGALRERSSEIAGQYAAALALGVGQFCTNPGLLVVPDGSEGDEFCGAIAAKLRDVSASAMLNSGIQACFWEGVAHWRELGAVPVLASDPLDGQAVPQLYQCTGEAFLSNAALVEEVFGPAGLVVRVRNEAELFGVVRSLPGQLTATIHFGAGDEGLSSALVPVLCRKVGRLIANGVPTGVEVSPAMVHGGPYPASTDSRFTAVGASAILRWLRPICFQNAPDAWSSFLG